MWMPYLFEGATLCSVPGTLRRCAPEIQRGGGASSGLRIDSHSTCTLQPSTQQSIADRHGQWSPSREYTSLFYAYYLFFSNKSWSGDYINHSTSGMLFRYLRTILDISTHESRLTALITRVEFPLGGFCRIILIRCKVMRACQLSVSNLCLRT